MWNTSHSCVGWDGICFFSPGWLQTIILPISPSNFRHVPPYLAYLFKIYLVVYIKIGNSSWHLYNAYNVVWSYSFPVVVFLGLLVLECSLRQVIDMVVRFLWKHSWRRDCPVLHLHVRLRGYICKQSWGNNLIFFSFYFIFPFLFVLFLLTQHHGILNNKCFIISCNP
jgi:hypothetical protein